MPYRPNKQRYFFFEIGLQQHCICFLYIFADVNMKVFAIILSIIVLGLTLTPCIDSAESRCSTTTAMDQQHPHSDDVDLCSPFCTCHCCQTCVNMPLALFNLVHCPIPVRLYISTRQDILHEFRIDLYKPPCA